MQGFRTKNNALFENSTICIRNNIAQFEYDCNKYLIKYEKLFKRSLTEYEF